MASASTKFIDLAGCRLAYRDVGDGPPIVLLHGYPMSSALWDGVLAALGPGVRAIAPDLPGFGDSEAPAGPLTISRHAGALAELVSALDLGPVHLVVHDLGGPVGLSWALDHPDRVRGLTVLNTFLTPRFRLVDELILGAMRTPGLRELFRTRLAFRTVVRLGFAGAGPSAERLAELARPWEGARSELLVRTFVEAFGEPGRPALRRVEAELRSVAPKLRIGFADRDPFCDAYMKALLSALPEVPVTPFPGGGHFFPLECPAEVAAFVRAGAGAR